MREKWFHEGPGEGKVTGDEKEGGRLSERVGGHQLGTQKTKKDFVRYWEVSIVRGKTSTGVKAVQPKTWPRKKGQKPGEGADSKNRMTSKLIKKAKVEQCEHQPNELTFELNESRKAKLGLGGFKNRYGVRQRGGFGTKGVKSLNTV